MTRSTPRPPAAGMVADLGRAGAGGLLFGVPLLLTMETWHLAQTMSRARVVVFAVAMCVLLVVLARVSGFTAEQGHTLGDHLVDAGVAVAVGTVVSGMLLWCLGVLEIGAGPVALARQVALGAVPTAIGATIARSQLASPGDQPADADGNAQEVALMVGGGVLVAYNIAPTDEVARLGDGMGALQAIVLAVTSLALLHAVVHVLDLPGTHAAQDGPVAGRLLVTVVGYVGVLAAMAFLLWSFGRLDDVAVPTAARMVVVLGLPGALGAAVARLVL